MLMVAVAFASAASAADLPKGFVYLSDVDPTIVQDMRYAAADNFTRKIVPGYHAAECILTVEAAKALAKVQADLRAGGYGVMVYDCYRPAKAVKRFLEWASQGGPPDADHNPRAARNRLIAEGYIAKKSGHSSGGTVDLTLVRLDRMPVPMGTGFDFFDPLAFTASKAVSPEARANRKRLVRAMARHGFRNYEREWWHFRYVREPFAGRAFDFDIEPRTH
jgi:D-alanyl-D-alanine dipeptidase